MKLPYDRSKIIPHKLNCYQCGDTGKVLATINDQAINALPYAFKCTFCDVSRFKRTIFPAWGTYYSQSYTVLTGIQGAKP